MRILDFEGHGLSREQGKEQETEMLQEAALWLLTSITES